MRAVPRSTRRQQILAVAAPLFARHGFYGVSVDDLGAAAGVSGPALYRHFRAKEEILAELLEGVSARLLEGGQERVASAPGPREALSALVDFHVDFALDNADVITVQARDMANLPEAPRREVRALQQRYVGVWADAIVDACGCAKPTAVAAAHAAFGLMNSTPHSARLARREMSLLLREMALGAIGSRERPGADQDQAHARERGPRRARGVSRRPASPTAATARGGVAR